MRIHRLLLQDFRGVARREIRFPEAGVVVLAGANEVGKSSLVEAMDLLLHERASSTKAAVRAIQPVGLDVGSVVEAELSIGPVRVVYRKQWNRGAATQLDLVEPIREQLTGRPAHERMTALLAAHLDADLYRAQRVLQSGHGGEKWTAAGSLTAALDEAAGRAVAQESGEDLVTAVEQEYRLFHTPTGRPTGAWKDLQRRHQVATATADAARAALKEVDTRAADHAAAELRLQALTDDITGRTDALESLRARRARMLELSAALKRAGAAVDAAVRVRDGADRALRDRSAAVGRLDDLTTEIDRVEQAMVRLRADLEPAQTDLAARVDLVTLAHEQSVAADAAARRAQLEADRQTDLAEWRELQATLDAVDAAGSAVAVAQRERGLLQVGPDEWTEVERAERALALAVTAAETAAARVDVELEQPEVGLTLDGRSVAGLTGHPVTEDLVLHLPGIARISIAPASGTDELARRVHAARRSVAALLRSLGVPDVAGAREQAARHRTVSMELERAQARLAELTGRRSRQVLADRAERLRASIGTDALPPEPDTADDRLDPRECVRAAEQEAVGLRTRWRTAAADRDAAAERLHSLQQHLTGGQAAAAALHDQRTLAITVLERLRNDSPDAEVSARLLQAQHAVDTCRETRALVRAECDAVAEPGLEDTLRAAETALADLIGVRGAAERTLLALTTELELIGAEGRQESVDHAESDLADCSRQLAAVTARAEGVALLREVLLRHRDQARAHYVAPFRQALVRLGRLWLGPTFDVTVGEDLQVLTRSLHGTSVPIGMLSTGAAEQVAVLIRLATASVVGGRDGVPVVLDDALGFTDPGRLATLGPVFSGLDDSQILLLTCDPDRYRAIPGATVLLLDPDTAGTRQPSPDPPVPAPPAPRTSRARAPQRTELSLFDSDNFADDPQLPLLLNPVRVGREGRSA